MVPVCRKADMWVCRVGTLGDTFLHHVGPDISCLSFWGWSGRHADIRHLPTKPHWPCPTWPHSRVMGSLLVKLAMLSVLLMSVMTMVSGSYFKLAGMCACLGYQYG